MLINENTLHLAGFALAHAAWSVSDLPQGELLCPLAFVQSDEGRELVRFEADTQEQAIANAMSTLEKEKARGKSWAFVREGLLRRDEEKIDVLLTSVWAPGMPDPLHLAQPFEPFAKRGKFRLLGELQLLDVEGPIEGRETIRQIVRQGILQHPKVGRLWVKWEAEGGA